MWSETLLDGSINQWTTRVLWGIEGLAILAVAALSCVILLMLLVPSPTPKVSVPALAMSDPELTAWRLVTLDVPATTVSTPLPEQVPVSKVAIRVLGILTHQANAMALLEYEGVVRRVYVGDVLDSAGVIRAITPAEILIASRGQLSRVPLRDESSQVMQAVPEKVLGESLEIGLPDELVELRWYRADSSPGALEITRLAARIGESLDIQVGDRLISVNGSSVEAIAKAPDEYTNVLTDPQVSVELLREGKQFTRAFETQTLITLWQTMHD